jgi:Xaa-Pro dipeptidase
MPIFSQQEMVRRVNNLRERMAEDQVDCVIATSYPSSYYLSGAPIHWFGRPVATIIPLEGEPTIVESIIELEHTLAQSRIQDIRTYYDFNPEFIYENPRSPLSSMLALVEEFIKQRKLHQGRIGIEGADLPLAHYRALQGILPEVELVDVSRMISQLRMVLSEEELQLVRAADAIADLGQQALIEAISPGKSAIEIEAPVKTLMTEMILERHPDKPFHLHALSGLGTVEKASGHSEWVTWNRDKIVEPGQLLETIIDVWLWGYWGNVERAVYVGEPDIAVRKPFDVMVEANQAAIEAVRPGTRLADVDRAAKDILSRHGYGTRSGTGCGRGIVSYEGNARELLMDVRLYSDVVLEPGMAFSIEPDLLVPEIGTFRHCNTVIVTENGCQVDSTIPWGVITVG